MRPILVLPLLVGIPLDLGRQTDLGQRDEVRPGDGAATAVSVAARRWRDPALLELDRPESFALKSDVVNIS
jgi:hypothetical protein